ncbi:hypothetical protein AYO44_05795 [Planctomycetaceae bacterium SCGC AG-212-F19]|nr:hypothetical protein AYO44_05795 [Planctomycetaceae bacterium SCGC AG-212-F19]
MTKPHLPPGPRDHLLRGGSLLEHARDQLGFLQRMAQEYGDIAYFRLGFDHCALINHPDLIEDALVKRAEELREPQLMIEAERVIGKVLLTAEGELHRQQRRILQHSFMRDKITSYAPAMIRHAARTRDRWTTGAHLDVAHEMMGLMLGIASQTLFGIDIEDSTDEFSAAFNEAAWYVGLMSYLPHGGLLDHIPLPSTNRFHRARARLHAAAAAIIAERRRTGRHAGDLLSDLLHAHEGGGPTADVDVENEVLAILMAGHETTARGITWAWYALSQNSDVEKLFHAELDSVLGAREPTVADVPRLRYTEMVFAEAIRLFPPIFSIERQTKGDYPIRDYVLPAGSTLILSPFVTQRTPTWYPEPTKFDPQRMSPEARAARPSYSFFSFGGGQRKCLGEPFAWTEAVLVLATLGQRWRLRLTPGTMVIPEPMMTLRPRDGLPMIAEART